VTIGAAVAKRISWKYVISYIGAQLIGACLAAFVIYSIMSGAEGFVHAGNFAANSVENYSICAGFLTEFVMTFVFLMVILTSTRPDAYTKFAPIAIGLTLVCIHLVTIPITNTSVNPARSVSQLLFSKNVLAFQQIWLFLVAPVLGAIVAGLWSRFCCCCSGCGSDCECGCHDKDAKKKAKK